MQRKSSGESVTKGEELYLFAMEYAESHPDKVHTVVDDWLEIDKRGFGKCPFCGINLEKHTTKTDWVYMAVAGHRQKVKHLNKAGECCYQWEDHR